MFYRIDNNLILESEHNILFRCIFTNGGVVPTGTISITSNGTYDVASYANANVNVPQGVVPTGTKEITQNGVENIATYEYVDVNVPQGVFPSGTKTITQNGVEDVESYKYVDVDVPQPSGTININANGTVNVNDYEYANVNVPGIVPSGTIPITANGTVDVTNYANANVNVPQGVFPSGDLNITSNGTYDVTNYENAIVNVSGGGAILASGSFTLDTNKYLYYDITDTPDSVYEIPHGLNTTPNFFMFWADGTITESPGGNLVYLFGAMTPTILRMYLNISTNSIMGASRSSGESSILSYGSVGNNIIADATKVTLKGSNSTTSRYLRNGVVYRWIAGYITI